MALGGPAKLEPWTLCTLCSVRALQTVTSSRGARRRSTRSSTSEDDSIFDSMSNASLQISRNSWIPRQLPKYLH